MTARRAVFLDRDGTLIDNDGYLGDADGVVPLPGVASALERLGRLGFVRVVVTNQSGVARGLFTEHDYDRVTARLRALLPGLDAVYACFHLEDGAVAPWNVPCDCRKPLPGMLLRAARELHLDLARSVLVGDDRRDVEAAQAAGVRAVLVRTGKGARFASQLAAEGVTVADDLAAFVATLDEEDAT